MSWKNESWLREWCNEKGGWESVLKYNAFVSRRLSVTKKIRRIRDKASRRENQLRNSYSTRRRLSTHSRSKIAGPGMQRYNHSEINPAPSLRNHIWVISQIARGNIAIHSFDSSVVCIAAYSATITQGFLKEMSHDRITVHWWLTMYVALRRINIRVLQYHMAYMRMARTTSRRYTYVSCYR